MPHPHAPSSSPCETVLERSLSPDLATDLFLPPLRCAFTSTYHDAPELGTPAVSCEFLAATDAGKVHRRRKTSRDPEEDNHNANSEQDRYYASWRSTGDRSGKLTTTARMPQTIGFHFDWSIGRFAAAAKEVNIKALCASIMLWRERNEVSPYLTWQNHQEDGQAPVRPTERGAVTDTSSVHATNWDILLQGVVRTSQDMHRRRKWNVRAAKNAVGWCQLEVKQAARCGKFVEDVEGGFQLDRALRDGAEAEGRTLYLGYRREVREPADSAMPEAHGVKTGDEDPGRIVALEPDGLAVDGPMVDGPLTRDQETAPACADTLPKDNTACEAIEYTPEITTQSCSIA
ncbi:hypothetical protein LTR72_001564 [Exophiala xenobiotica]|nr:hypothetical protein LTR92_001457 [Exophiala xenobiotica]KAK5230029.1 hypothetical protein LTR72_001564 [Exophiala xenobiotica]KAK5295995.1 hypothetical protein LTR14_003626 [Exophiala xenobiotica]KAK5319079.1 hypothetical protein LTR93_007774 [Exophiala xenobiotica]KAK5372530.1 hypothetical protein LTS13_006271 [Exophiala xenobiotica]